jgi:predicted ATP-grasp superfamily ATP-dependent carboligase
MTLSEAAHIAESCQPGVRVLSRPTGVVVIGGHYGALGLVRSLGRRGIAVLLVIQRGEHILAAFSRYATRVLHCPDNDSYVDFLLRAAHNQNLRGWLLLPTTDETVGLVARSSEKLSTQYTLTTPPWTTIERVCNKRFLYQLAGTLGIDRPWTFCPASIEELELLDCQFPMIIKPAHREASNALTLAKAWQVNSRRELLARYKEARRFMASELLMIQEVVPGGGEAQFSYAALCSEGQVLASVVARRTRQFPLDFGRASSYVETIEDPGLGKAATRLLNAVRMTGLVEVEFKRDSSGRYKLLDVNPRVWTWHMLCARAGVDFPYLLWLLARGESFPRPQAVPGVWWMHLSADLPMALQEIRAGRLSLKTYVTSLFRVQESAVFAIDDPLPGLLEIPIFIYRWVLRLLRRAYLAGKSCFPARIKRHKGQPMVRRLIRNFSSRRS